MGADVADQELVVGAKGPRVSVDLVACGTPTSGGPWPLTWAIVNLATDPLQIKEVWLPHARFVSERLTVEQPRRLEGGETCRVELPARWQEEPGVEVENAFVILRVVWRGETWRIFNRLTVRSRDDGAPQPRTELVTLQRVELSV